MYRYTFGYSYGYAALDIIGTFILCVVAYAVAGFVTRWNMFIRAGERGWKALIPFYGDYIEWKIAGMGKDYFVVLILYAALTGTTALLSLLGTFGIILSLIFWVVVLAFVVVVLIRKSVRLAHAFGQSDLFGLMGLLLFPLFGLLVLSWGHCSYTAPARRLGPDGEPLSGLRDTMLGSFFSDIRRGRIIGE